MPSTYLQSGEYATYGVPSADASDVLQASMVIDSYLDRNEGLVWAADSQGMPCDMAAVEPSLSLTLAASIAPGQNVVVPFAGPIGALQTGDVVVLDRATLGSKEACVIAAVAGAQVTLASVINAHSSGATADLGLVIDEQKYMPSARPITFVSRTPVVRIVSGIGRYAYGRRGDATNYMVEEFNLLASISHFGGPPAWERFDPLVTDFDASTGQMWIPAGLLMAYYSEVRIRYVAGYAQANLPSQIKQACANIVASLQSSPLRGNMKSMKAGDSAIERFGPSVMDAETKVMLDSFRSRAFI